MGAMLRWIVDARQHVQTRIQEVLALPDGNSRAQAPAASKPV
jgi:hypothetical protein